MVYLLTLTRNRFGFDKIEFRSRFRQKITVQSYMYIVFDGIRTRKRKQSLIIISRRMHNKKICNECKHYYYEGDYEGKKLK